MQQVQKNNSKLLAGPAQTFSTVTMSDVFESRGATIPLLYGDARRFETVIINLLMTALNVS
jgi:hypothetical protein